jgi:hypothetical protein
MKAAQTAILTTVVLLACASVSFGQLANTNAVAEDNSSAPFDAQAAPPENPQSGAAPPTGKLPNPFEDPRDRIWYPGDTERIKPLTTKLIGNILLDQKEIWSSPFHMHKKNAKWWIGIGGVTAALIATDRRSSEAIANDSALHHWGSDVSQIGATYTVLPLIAGFYGYGVVAHDAQARETGVLGTEALLDSLIVVTALKAVGGRVRPDSTTGERSQFFDGSDSFPSGHTIESWAVASVIAHEYKHYGGKWVPYVAYGLATAVSASRYAAQRHYLSDVVAGGAMGWFIGRYVYQTHQDHAAHRHPGLQPVILPEFDPASRSYGVALRFGSR